jgi:hypothetical protein
MAGKKPLVLTNGSIKEIGAGDTVPISNGGTGATTATAALNALLPSQTGNNTKVLGTDGTNTSWVAVSGGGAGNMNQSFNSGTGGTSLAATETSVGTVTITPQSASSAIMIVARMTATKDATTTRRTVTARVKRGSTQIGRDCIIYAQNVASSNFGPAIISAIDSTHNTTSTITYTLFALEAGALSTSDDWEIFVVELMGAQGGNGVNSTILTNSVSSVSIDVSSKTFTYASATNLGWMIGSRLRAANSSTNWMEGVVTSVSATSVTILVDLISGTGTFSSWNIALAGEKGQLTPRVQSVTSAATVTPNASSNDLVDITAQAVALTLASPSGTPVNGQVIEIRIKDNGVVRAITWNAIYRAFGLALPTSTKAGKTIYASCVYNSGATKWDVFITNEL